MVNSGIESATFLLLYGAGTIKMLKKFRAIRERFASKIEKQVSRQKRNEAL
jgi:hypothetical protein